MNSKVSYEENGISVTIETTCPEHLHENLMKGLATALASGGISDQSQMSALLIFLTSLIPKEDKLSIAYEAS